MGRVSPAPMLFPLWDEEASALLDAPGARWSKNSPTLAVGLRVMRVLNSLSWENLPM